LTARRFPAKEALQDTILDLTAQVFGAPATELRARLRVEFHIMTNQNRSRFARNAVANWIAFLFTAIVGFFLSPFVVEHLGATRYGVWSLLAGLVGYLGLLDLGIRQAVNRYVAHHRAVGAHEESPSGRRRAAAAAAIDYQTRI
jgi:hypothetical protein